MKHSEMFDWPKIEITMLWSDLLSSLLLLLLL